MRGALIGAARCFLQRDSALEFGGIGHIDALSAFFVLALTLCAPSVIGLSGDGFGGVGVLSAHELRVASGFAF